MISERNTDIEIKYIFIKSFKYHNPEEAESMNGHPHAGRIYRSVFNLHTKHHRLLLPDGIIMGFNQLVGDSGSAEFELQEVNINNILDFDIREEDLSIFLQPDDDIFFEQPTIIIEGMKNLQNAIQQHDEDEADFSHRASNAVLSLWSVNPSKGEILIQLANRLIESDLSSHQDPTYYLRFHESKGDVLNISKAIQHLDVYISENKKINGEPNDLLEAMEAIVVELERKSELE